MKKRLRIVEVLGSLEVRSKMEVNISRITCADCGVTFWLTDSHKSRLEDSHETFSCPNGHNNYYPGKNDAEKMQEKLDQQEEKRKECSENLENERLRNEELRKSINGYKGMLGRYKKEKGKLKYKKKKTSQKKEMAK